MEYLNPGGTSKDRIAASMINEAEASGELTEGGTVVEGTSGSTGICLASLCRAKGYRCIIVMPDDQVSQIVLRTGMIQYALCFGATLRVLIVGIREGCMFQW